VKLLLDTHAALWWLARDRRLPGAVHDQLGNPAHDVLVSAVVAWEVAVKRSIGKLDVGHDVIAVLLGSGASPLPIGLDHAAAVERLPWYHRDPFDRLLVAQAQLERATLVSGDSVLRRYDVPVIW